VDLDQGYWVLCPGPVVVFLLLYTSARCCTPVLSDPSPTLREAVVVAAMVGVGPLWSTEHSA
jgi:hypothetical protein